MGPVYFWQAFRGQLELFNRARPIEEVLADPRAEPHHRRALEELPRIRSFIVESGLKETSSYQDFVDLKRDSVVWVVSACEPLKFDAGRWSFPIVGSFTYIGWFDPGRAERMRRRLEEEGLDADVRGAAAYSTLGWFRDPVLSTLIERDPDSAELVEILIHESVHATLHLKGLSTLNESMAQFVAEKLTPSYLERHRGPGSKERYQKRLLESRSRRERLRRGYQDLEAIYASSESEEIKRRRKDARIASLRSELNWPEKRTLNNATLIQFATYESGEQGFEAIWKACDGEVGPFLEVIRQAESRLANAGDTELSGALGDLAASKGCARSLHPGAAGAKAELK